MSRLSNEPNSQLNYQHHVEFNKAQSILQEYSEVGTPSYNTNLQQCQKNRKKSTTEKHLSDFFCIPSQPDDKQKQKQNYCNTQPNVYQFDENLRNAENKSETPIDFQYLKSHMNSAVQLMDSKRIKSQKNLQQSQSQRIQFTKSLKSDIKMLFIQSIKTNLLKFSQIILKKRSYPNILNKNLNNEILENGNSYFPQLCIQSNGILIIIQLIYFILISQIFNNVALCIAYEQFSLFVCLINHSYKNHSFIILIIIQCTSISVYYFYGNIIYLIFIKYLFALLQLYLFNQYIKQFLDFSMNYYLTLQVLINLILVHHIFTSCLQTLYAYQFSIVPLYSTLLVKIAFLRLDSNYSIYFYVLLLVYIVLISQYLENCLNLKLYQNPFLPKSNYIIHNYLNKNKASQIIKSKVQNFIQKAIEFDFQEDKNQEKSLEILPQSLRYDIMVDIRLSILEKQKIFKKNFSSQFLKNLSVLLSEQHIGPEKILNKTSDTAFIVLEGEIELNLISSNETMKLGNLTPGNLYGQYELFKPIDSRIQIKSKKFSRILIIKRDIFKQCVSLNQKDEQRFFNIRDHLIEGFDESKLHLTCLLCNQKHFTLSCPQFQYIPNKERVILQYLFQENQNRKKYIRIQKKRIQALKISFQIHNVAQNIQQELNISQQQSERTSEYINQLYSNSNFNYNQNVSFEDTEGQPEQSPQYSNQNSSNKPLEEDPIESDNIKNIPALQRNGNVRQTHSTAQFNKQLGFNNNSESSSHQIQSEYRANKRKQSTRKDFKEDMLMMLQNQQQIYSNQLSMSSLLQSQNLYQNQSQSQPQKQQLLENTSSSALSKTISYSQSQNPQTSHSQTQQTIQQDPRITNIQQNQVLNEKDNENVINIESNLHQQPSQNQIISRSSLPKLTFQYDHQNPNINNIQQSQNLTQQPSHLDRERAFSRRSQSYSQSYISSYYTDKSRMGKKSPSIIGYQDSKLPSEIMPVSSANIQTIDDEGNENFKYMSSQNVIPDKRERIQLRTKTKTKTRTKSDFEDSNPHQSDYSKSFNEQVSKTLRLKGELDYLSKERKIISFETMNIFKHYMIRFNSNEVIARYNNWMKLKQDQIISNTFSFFFVQKKRGQRMRKFDEIKELHF